MELFFCCVNAYHILQPPGWEINLEKLKNQRIELSLEEKLQIVDNLENPLEIDISGGEPLLFRDNLEIIKKLSKKIGKENLSITTTAKGLNLVSLNFLEGNVGEIGFSYDFPYEPNNLRPFGFISSNLKSIRKISKTNLHTLAQIILTRLNISPSVIKQIYRNLSDIKVNRLLLMKYFLVGRGVYHNGLVLDSEEHKKAIELYRSLENSEGPKVLIQTVLKEGTKRNSINLNITSQGLLISNPWAYDEKGNPLKEFILGDLI